MSLSRWLGAVVLSLLACKPRPAPPVAVDAAPPAAPSEDAGPAATVAREALAGYPAQTALMETAADGGVRAKLGVVAVPLGAREPRPLVIALHGGSDHPEWACGAWMAIASAHAFVVCPRGVGAEAALAWSSPADTKARIARAVAAARAMFGSWIREDPSIVLVGFSMGATQTAYLAQSEPALYRRIVLAESAYAPEPAMRFAAPWAKGGGERAIFLCTTKGCEATYRRAARGVAAQGVPSRLDIAGTTEHGMWPEVLSSMRRDWPWLVEGVPGWEGYVPPQEGELPGTTERFGH